MAYLLRRVLVLALPVALAFTPALAQQGLKLTAAAINEAALDPLFGRPADAGPASAAMARLQVLLDRAGVSPGVIDGYPGDNVGKAIAAYETVRGLASDGLLDAELAAGLMQSPEPAIVPYTIVAEDLADLVPALPDDYAELAKRDRLGFTSVTEKLAERFHMDADLLADLNPSAAWTVGEMVMVAAPGAPVTGEVAHIEADKILKQLRAYDSAGRLIAAYPATIGSEDNPSPTGTHRVDVVVFDPTYTYNPRINFQQGSNTEVLVLPAGPNGPVGTVWIDLSEPTYGIHGTPEPSLIDKVGSHGCVRLTNWDAEELARMVKPGVMVTFVGS